MDRGTQWKGKMKKKKTKKNKTKQNKQTQTQKSDIILSKSTINVIFYALITTNKYIYNC